jgi:hypothetical protein
MATATTATRTKPRERDEALMMAEALRTLPDVPGFKLYENQLKREKQRAAAHVGATPEEMMVRYRDHRNVVEYATAFAIELARREGYLECLQRVLAIRGEMVEELQAGRIPWQKRAR